jgi:hypothetical protein
MDYEEQKLGWVDLQVLAILVKNFRMFYNNYPVIGIDNHSVQLRTVELLRLSMEYGLEVEFSAYTDTDGAIYHTRKITIDDVIFLSQDQVEEADNG